MKFLGLTFAMILPFTAVAQEQAVPPPVLQELAKDLAEMQEAIASAQDNAAIENANASTSIVTVTAQDAVIRSSTNTSSAVVATPEVGEPLEVLEEDRGWYKVQPLASEDAFSSGWMSATEVQPAQSRGSSEELFFKLTEKASKLRDSYRNNPYLTITGFTVEVGLPPSVAIDFEFK